MTNSPSEAAAATPRPGLRAVETGAPEATPTKDAAPEAAPPAAPDRDPEMEAHAPRRRSSAKAAAGNAAKSAARAARKSAGGRAQPAATRRAAAESKRAKVAAAGTARRPARRRRAAVQPPELTPEMAAALAAAAAAPEVRPARVKLRHWLVALSFVLIVLTPFVAAIVYLYTRAADQYHSEVAFSIRSEEAGSATAGLLGALTSIGTGSASDADILHEYVRSQAIVEAIDRDLDLRAIYNHATGDPVFTLGPDASIEDLVGQWREMTDVAFDSATGIIHIRANAFVPEDATAIAVEILSQSSALVNQLSEQAREDAVRFAREEFDEAEKNLRGMRQRLSEFRRENRIVDPSGDVAGQSGLLNALQSELAQALVERDVLLSFVGEGDQRVIQANRRIDAVTGRIEAERAALGVAGTQGALPDVVGRYEELLVDLEFANTAYTQTLAGLAGARAEARRQSRYLAPHIEPTLAERALYPQRTLLAGLVGLFLLLGWGAFMLIYYNLRDNR